MEQQKIIFAYPCVITRVNDASGNYFLIQFVGLDEAFTEVNSVLDIEKYAKEVLEISLLGRIEDGLFCPIPSEIKFPEFDSEKENQYLHTFYVSEELHEKIISYRGIK